MGTNTDKSNEWFSLREQTFIELFKIRDKAYLKSAVPTGESLFCPNDQTKNTLLVFARSEQTHCSTLVSCSPQVALI